VQTIIDRACMAVTVPHPCGLGGDNATKQLLDRVTFTQSSPGI